MTPSAHPEALLTIRLDGPEGFDRQELFVGARKRLATVTSVRFLDDRRLVAAHLRGKRLYLVSFDLAAGTYSVESCIPTEFGGKPVVTDLVDFDGVESVVTSNFREHSVSLYRLEGNGLCHARDLPIAAPEAGTCHGVKFVPPDGRLVCATCTSHGCDVVFISRAAGEVVYRFRDAGWLPKDICFVDERRMVVIWTRGAPSSAPQVPQATKVSLIAVDLTRGHHRVLAESVREASLIDGCAHHAGRVYVTDQMGDQVLVYRIDGDALSFEQTRPGYSFPHGVDVLPGANLLAVTNYGATSITITRL